MAKGGKGRKGGGGGGGGKQRKYSRDNLGRFASTGTGATARGGRLLTAKGNKRKTQTMQTSATPKSTIGKPKVLKPGAITGKIKPAAAQSRAAQLRQRADRLESQGNRLMGVGRRGDTAMTNISLNSRARTTEFNQGIKGLRMSRQAQSLREKADRVEQRAAQSSAKALSAAAKPKRTRSVESMRTNRAKQIEKRRGMNINNPAAWRQESAGRMAANAARTQQRALAFYKTGKKSSRAATKTAKGSRLGGTRRTMQAAAPKNTTANRTGQSKTLNRFNSRPVGTMIVGKGIGDNLVPSTKRVPLDIQRKASDEAFARMATKAARAQAKIPAQRAAKQTTAQRAARAVSNQKRVVASIQSKGGRRPTPSRKQRRSLLTAEAAKRFYSTNAIDTLKVNVKKPGFRLPRKMR